MLEDLKNYQTLKSEILDLEKRIDGLKENFRVSRIRADKVQESFGNQGILEVLEAVEELESVYYNLLIELINRTKSIEGVLRHVKGLEGQIIRKRYIDGLEWRKIALESNYSLRTVYRLHDRGLELFEMTLRDSAKNDTIKVENR